MCTFDEVVGAYIGHDFRARKYLSVEFGFELPSLLGDVSRVSYEQGGGMQNVFVVIMMLHDSSLRVILSWSRLLLWGVLGVSYIGRVFSKAS